MINLTQLYREGEWSFPGDALRYAGRDSAASVRPVVVWNCTRRCNLRCVHCYAAGDAETDAPELTTDEAKALIDDLATFGAPVLLLSGGEPLLRDDLFPLLRRAADQGLRTVLSTNGTCITPDAAAKLSAAGVAYVGVSLDAASAARNDAFRGRDGAFDDALAGLRACRNAHLRVGLRFTMTRSNLEEIDALFDLIEREEIHRVCFYHFTPVGRGRKNAAEAPTPEQTRSTLDRILARVKTLRRDGQAVEVLTVGNHSDGPYVYLKLLREEPHRAEKALQLLRRNGGNRSGLAIASVSWDGAVHPDQFWRRQVVGNIRQTPFSELWSRPAEGSLLAQLRRRRPLLPPRCRSCRFLDVCNGNLRARAEAAGNGPWGDDPACYLRDEEIRGSEA
ncbi:MAG: radical SAM protein [Phycisphaerae bacterium]|nr:radical SAM protein [Phycisphaerae bacterium]